MEEQDRKGGNKKKAEVMKAIEQSFNVSVLPFFGLSGKIETARRDPSPSHSKLKWEDN